VGLTPELLPAIISVTLARGGDIDSARRIARDAAAAITIELHSA